MRNPYTLERNDVDGAIEVYREALREARVMEVGQVLIMLQDDPTALFLRLDALHAEEND